MVRNHCKPNCDIVWAGVYRVYNRCNGIIYKLKRKKVNKVDLTDEELNYTRKVRGIDRMVEVDVRLIDSKVKELRKWQEEANGKGIDDDWYYFEGQIKALNAIKNEKLSEL